MAYDVDQLLQKTDAELDAMFTAAAADPGPIPDGKAEGTAIVANGTQFSGPIAKIINLFGWQGKTFNRESPEFGTLRNRITAFGINAIVAEVKYDNSLLDGKKCILLDYSKTSTVAERVRDEIRMIAPNTYLGRVYWGTKPTIHFALQFEG
jgi:hypothetical protein